ncbi:MAG: hypothetical protein ACI9Y7_000014 [Dokdonia sp.]|jgi:hypothetical protein
MKLLYEINKWWMITTLFLYITFWGGILFQILLGVIQIISCTIYFTNWSKIKVSLKKPFIIYGIITSLLLEFLFSGINESIFIVWGTSGIVAFYFLYLSYQQNKFIHHEL